MKSLEQINLFHNALGLHMEMGLERCHMRFVERRPETDPEVVELTTMMHELDNKFGIGKFNEMIENLPPTK